MSITKAELILFIAVVSSLTACGSQLEDQLLGPDPQVLINGGATRIGGEQTRAHVSGNTEVWKEGSVYYKPDGELELRWHKVRSRGTWEVAANGVVCWNVPDWKTLDIPDATSVQTARSARSCHYYLDGHGKITTVQGKYVVGVHEIKTGRKL
ncbi:MAG: hypothetical protein GWP56_15960 [Gammaproteobacteria bacterium]|nr:hypothetical protein [Gammaproteobacteria bacterium]